MNILLIDTSGETGTIALANSDAATEPTTATIPGRSASERLLPEIRKLAAPLTSLAAIVVVHGPGSFTGVRVGLSAAKGLCEALGVPLVAISRLAVMAHAAQPPPGTRIHAVLDAGRGEFYLGAYEDGTCLREALLTRDELMAEIAEAPNRSAVVACEPAVVEVLSALTPRVSPLPTAASAVPLALLRLKTRAFDDIATLDANYLRRTDAEIFAKPRPSGKLGPVEAPLP